MISLYAARGSEGIIVYTLTRATLIRDREHGTVRSGNSLSIHNAFTHISPYTPWAN